MKSLKVILSFLLILQAFSVAIPQLRVSAAQPALNVTPQSDAEILVQSLLGEGVEYDPASIVFQNSATSMATFTGGNSIVGFENGIILSTGDATKVVGPNIANGTSSDNLLPGDSTLNTLSGGQTYNASFIEFKFKPVTNVISFQYVFSSEEYNEYVNASKNDVFGLFINGTNASLLPNSTTAVSIDTVNLNTNAQYFINNDVASGAALNTEMDGLTVVFNAQAEVNVNEWNTIKIAIADGGDSAFDSNVFLKANSIVSEVVEPGQLKVTGPTDDKVTIVRENGTDGTVSVDWTVTYNDGSQVTGNTKLQDGQSSQEVQVTNAANATKFTLVTPYGGATIHAVDYEVTFKETIAPITTININGTNDYNGDWYKSDVSISFTVNEEATTYYSIDGSSWFQYSNAFEITSSGTHTIQYYSVDTAGNIENNGTDGTYKSISFNVDKMFPTLSVSKETNDWISSDLKILVDADGTISAIDLLKWLPGEQEIIAFSDNGNVFTNEFSVSENGVYTVYAIDKAGNAVIEVIEVTNIDKLAPTLTLTQTSLEWTNGNVEVTVAANGTGSTITTKMWAQGDLTAEEILAQGTDIAGTTFTTSENDTYSVVVIDQAGLQTVRTINIGNIDKLEPVINLTPSTTNWTNEDITVHVDADGTGSNVSVKYLQGEKTVSDFLNAGTTISNTFAVSENGTYTVYARDEAGNESTASITITNIDKVMPTLSVNPSTTDWTNSDVTVTTIAEGTGSNVTVKWLEGNKTAGDFINAGTEITNEFIVLENGTYTVYAVDQAGNYVLDTITVANIDKLQPTIALSPEITTWTNEDVNVFVQASGSGSPIVEMSWMNEEKELFGMAYNNESFNGNFTVAENGTYKFYALDAAGNEITQTIEITNIDKVLPTVTLTQNPDAWTNEDVTILVNADGTISDSTVKWLAGNKTVSDFTNAGNVITNELIVSENGIYTVYVVDQAGNAIVKTIEVTNIDKDAPIATFDVTGALGNNDWFTTNATITLNATDDLSGVALIEYRLNGGDWTMYNSPVTLTDGEYEVEYRVIDIAGNISLNEGQPHVYEYVSANGYSWTDAQADAQLRYVNGQQGYLATITSAEEQASVEALLQGMFDAWIGATDVANEGQFVWQDGPEAGKPVTYTNWDAPTQPDNAGGNENYVQLFPNGKWNDLPVTYPWWIDGYIVEYGGMPTVIKIDTTLPVTTATMNKEKNENNWYSENVTITLDATETGSGLDYTEYSLDGTNWLTYEGAITLEQGAQTVDFRTVDIAGNVEAIKTELLNIDTLEPTLSLTLNPTNPTNGLVEVIVAANGTGSAIAGKKWAPGQLTAADFANGGYDIEGTTFSLEANGLYSVYVVDQAGHTVVQVISIENIDKLDPTIEYTYNNAWTNEDVTVTVTADGTGSPVGIVKWHAGNDTVTSTTEVTDFNVVKNGLFTIYVIDAAGNEAVKVIEITNIDKVLPITKVKPSTTAPAQSIEIEVYANGTISEIAELKWLQDGETVVHLVEAGMDYENTFEITANGEYTLVVTDEAGNTSTQSVTITNIDQVAPSITLTPSTTDETTEKIDVSVVINEVVEVSKWLTGEATIADFENAGTEVKEGKFSVSKNGVYTVYAIDLAGNESITTITITNIIPPYEVDVDDNNGQVTQIKQEENGQIIVDVYGDGYKIGINKKNLTRMIENKLEIVINAINLSLNIDSENLVSDDVEIVVEKLDIAGSKSAYKFTIIQNGKKVTTFKKPVTLRFAIDASKVNDTSKLQVYYLNETVNNWELIGGSYADGTMTAIVDHFSTYAVFDKDPNEKEELPNTATATYNYIYAGMIILLAGIVVLVARRRKTV